MRYIDADMLNKQIEIDSKGNEGQYGDEWQFIDTINSMPTADVVDRDKAQKEIDYWHDKAQSYERTIAKLTLNQADVRENIKAQKVIGGGEHDGATCWFECSQCHGTVDIDDAYCKHCGAQMER